MSEERKIFDKKFVHFMWDDELEGKMGFAADAITSLQTAVDKNDILRRYTVKQPGSNSFPIEMTTGDCFKFFYYDPLYIFKEAWKDGRPVQYMTTINIKNEWADVPDSWNWNINSDTKYRIRPEKAWRPFKDINELQSVWCNKRPLDTFKTDLDELIIWVHEKQGPRTIQIRGFNYNDNQIDIGHWCSLEYLYNIYEFLDGTSCGVEEEI